jgi:membrane associated rhomboid family serine protease
MFPIRDHNPSDRAPFVTWALIAANAVVFLLFTLPVLNDEAALIELYTRWGVVPVRVTQGFGWETLVTSQFLHAGILHIAGNMLFLWVFGDNLEDFLGHAGFLAFYLACGAAAALMQVVADPGSPIPMVGASGAVAGVMGGYLLLYPRARVDVLFIIIVVVRVIPLPAWIMLGVWFGFEALNSYLLYGLREGGVAHLAHAGGFLAGALLVLPLWLRRGGRDFWRARDGHPPHPPRISARPTTIPTVRRRR